MPEFDERQRQELRSHAQVAREAVEEGARQMAILWEARLNLAMATGDDEAVRAAISESRSLAYLDNCNCSTGVLA
jgi:hypothetical protein